MSRDSKPTQTCEAQHSCSQDNWAICSRHSVDHTTCKDPEASRKAGANLGMCQYALYSPCSSRASIRGAQIDAPIRELGLVAKLNRPLRRSSSTSAAAPETPPPAPPPPPMAAPSATPVLLALPARPTPVPAPAAAAAWLVPSSASAGGNAGAACWLVLFVCTGALALTYAAASSRAAASAAGDACSASSGACRDRARVGWLLPGARAAARTACRSQGRSSGAPQVGSPAARTLISSQ